MSCTVVEILEYKVMLCTVCHFWWCLGHPPCLRTGSTGRSWRTVCSCCRPAASVLPVAAEAAAAAATGDGWLVELDL